MSDISKLLEAAASQKKTHPISVNAEDLFFKGHISAEECAMLCKGEQVAMSIRTTDKIPDGEPACMQEIAGKVVMSQNTARVEKNATIGYIGSVIKKAEEMTDAAISEWIPSQINNTLIRTKRCNTQIVDDPLCPRIEVRFTLLDIEKETSQTIATAISVDTRLLVGDEIKDKPFWDEFRYAVHNQFTTITLQLIKAIKTGNFGMNH